MTFICPSFLVALALLGEPTPREVTWNGWIVADTGGHMYFFNGPYALIVAPTLHAQLAQWRNRAVKLTGSVTMNPWGDYTELVGIKSIREVAALEHPCNIEVQRLRLDEYGTLRFTVNLMFPGRSRHWPDGSMFVETDDFRLIIVNEGTGDIVIQPGPAAGCVSRESRR